MSLILFLLSCSAPQKNQDQQIKDKRIADSISFEEKKRIVLEAAEKERILKETSLGIWFVSFYVDEFGEPTKQGYIGSSKIFGVFSNSATENSDLAVDLLISSSSNISIQLFEYAGRNPVKDGVEHGYKIRVKQDTIPPVQFYATNYSDRLTLNKNDSKRLNDMLLKGGNFKFSIVEDSDYSNSKYSFEIPDASGYKNALKQLNEKK